MARKPISFSRSDVKAAWKLLEDMGTEPVSVTIYTDGSFQISTSKHAPNEPKNEFNEWDEVLK